MVGVRPVDRHENRTRIAPGGAGIVITVRDAVTTRSPEVSIMELAGVAAWYVGGFISAAVLIRHGHTRTVMWFCAILLGGLLAGPALVCVVRRSHIVHHHGPSEGAPPPSPSAVLALLDSDDDGAVADVAGRLRRTGELVVVVGRVGHEASTPWLDTGERQRVSRQLAFACRRIDEPCHTVVSSGFLPDVVRDAGQDLTVRLLVAPAQGTGRHRRVDLEHVAAELGCPLLLVPSHAPHAAGADRMVTT